MRKTIIIIMLSLVMLTGSVMSTEIKAEAAATTTVTAIGVAKAIMVLLAIAGVGIAAGTIFDNGQIEDSAVATFTSWLNNHDPEFFTQFMVAASAITAGRVINTLNPSFYRKLKTYVQDYFGTDTTITTQVGTNTFSINKLAISGSVTSYYAKFSNGSTRYFHGLLNYSVIPTTYIDNNGQTTLFFIPVNNNPSIIGASGSGSCALMLDGGGTNVTGINYGGVTNRTTEVYKGLVGSNFAVFKSGVNQGSVLSTSRVLNNILSAYYSGQYASVTEDVVAKPFATVGDVAATSTDASVVGAGQTITEDGNGEIVIDGDTTINLSNINIDEWLKSLAEGTQTYAQAMQAIGLAAVNTQEQTLEEVQAIAHALNPAAAGTNSITGNYTVNLIDLFPFCIPFDLYRIIQCFNADPVAPSATITIPVGYDGNTFAWEEYQISLEDFNSVASVVRVLEYVLFVIGLMLITRKLIEG